MENRTQTGNGGGIGVAAGTLLLDQFQAIFAKARETVSQYPDTTAIVLAAAIAEAKWCYETSVFVAKTQGSTLPPDVMNRLLEIPVPTAAQKQNAANLERQREHA